ncbi:MAG: hypothetical protein D6776_06270 [Planctomycetota bacterium]|nr:MAG: hypothetical protein D6776_06270 [Planctomycetota bacterium]
MWAERWYAYHEGETLRFVQPERDLRVERASGLLRSYALRLGGATVRRVELEQADLSPPPFDAAIFTLQGRIDEARSRALGMQTISRCLRGALRMLIDAWAEAKREQRDRAPAVLELSFAEALAGAFGTPLRGELRRAAPVLWEALGAERGTRQERLRQLRALLFERLRSMLARARTVHGVDGAAARALLQQAARARREVAEAIDPDRFAAALDRAERRVVAAVLDAEWDALVARLAREEAR